MLMRTFSSIAFFVLVTGCSGYSGIPRGSDGGRSAEGGIPDATCFGTAPFSVCLAAPPTGPLTIAEGPILIDIVNSGAWCSGLFRGGEYCVLAGTSISLRRGEILAFIPKPLVLIASDSIEIDTTSSVNVSSLLGRSQIGAGGNYEGCAPGMTPGSPFGGGAGGSFAGLGGHGGNGGSGGTGGISGAVATAMTLRGGCAGQNGDDSDLAPGNQGLGGNGGGAVLLVAGRSIEVNGIIDASGAGGSGGYSGAGGGGGGSGGMIVLNAPSITGSGLILANGGGGGEGGKSDDPLHPGVQGANPSSTDAALGGEGQSVEGGNGGNGSAGATAGSGGAGKDGTSIGGGGGGGGGAGFIMVRNGASLDLSHISPAPTHF
jgi:hypothetical protein